jgi:casein kinase 1
MKLNNGKGWEVLKAHPSAVHQLQQSGAHQNSSTAVNVHGQPHARQQKGTTHLPIDHHRLNADLPKPGVSRPPGRSPRDLQAGGKYAHPDVGKRQSKGELPLQEAGSNQAQFQHSQQNLTPNRSAPQQTRSNPVQQRQEPEKQSFAKKLMNVLCCGGALRVFERFSLLLPDPIVILSWCC